VRTVTLPNLTVIQVVHVFVGFVQIVVDRLCTYRGWKVYLSLWLHMEVKSSYDLSPRTCFTVALQLWLRNTAI